jgi:hypothetical protein
VYKKDVEEESLGTCAPDFSKKHGKEKDRWEKGDTK